MDPRRDARFGEPNSLDYALNDAEMAYRCGCPVWRVRFPPLRSERLLQYFPERRRTMPAAAGLAEAEEVVLDTAGGERVIVWHVPPREGRPVFSISTATAVRSVGARSVSACSSPTAAGL
jgi:hypothetical protein